MLTCLELDAGDILLQEEIQITPNMKTLELSKIIAEKGGEILAKPTVDFFCSTGYTEKYTPIFWGEFFMHSFRFHVMWRRENEEEFRDFFQTNDIYEAKDFAMRLAFEEVNVVYVEDTKLGERVRDFDAEKYKK